ncbi:MAG: PA14 domain-containing protein [Bacteroidota bacterium]
MKKTILTFVLHLVCFCGFSQTEKRVKITAVAPSENTGQDYSPWLNDAQTAGRATITASQAGNANYLAPENVVRTQLVQTSAPTSTGKIPIDGKRWYQLNNTSNGLEGLFDGRTDVKVATGWGKIFNTYDAYYPLFAGEEMSLESIKFYDGEGSNVDAPVTLSIITATWQRIPIATFTGTKYNQWVGPYPANANSFKLTTPVKNARYLVITASWAFPTEVEFYGTYQRGSATTPPSPEVLASQKQVKFKQTIGVNAFEWDVEEPNRPLEINESKLKALKSFTRIRHYMDWEKLEWQEGKYTFNPTHHGGWNYDALYQRLKAEGIEVLACLKTIPAWMRDTYPTAERDTENVPVRYGKNFSDPKSYLEQARVAFQFVARYGSNKQINKALLSVDKTSRWPGDAINEVKTGLDLIDYIECENERDKWWKGRKAYQTAREYAANLSAFYDGHKNTLGPGVGVKNADPTIKVVMAGLALPNTDYVKGMIDWCKQYRGYKPDGTVNLCWDIINYHLYANDAKSSQGGKSTRGAAPEVSEAGQVAGDFLQMAHVYAKGMPVWITETGYDVNQDSPLKAIAIGSKSVLQTQADWILRNALLYARSGVERVFFYQLYDDNTTGMAQFGSSGLLNQNKTRKPAADYLYQANKLLGEYSFKQTINRYPIVDRYEYQGKAAYVLVVPDEKSRTADYTLDLGSSPSASLFRPAIGSDRMLEEKVSTNNGKLKIRVTETPIFVLPSTTTSSANCPASGSAQREYWLNISGTTVSAIPVNTTPTGTSQLTAFEIPANIADHYGTRIRGYICPPQSGHYTFWLSGDNHSELWLSTNDQPSNKSKIASLSGWTNIREWKKYATQQSAVIKLEAGQRYYIEALQIEESGGDHLAVAWQLPNGALEAPIAGGHLSPFQPAQSLNSARTASEPTTITDGQEGTKAELSAYPNPTTSRTTVKFTLATPIEATLEVYDMHSRLVRQLFVGAVEAGVPKEFTFSSEGLPLGIYLLLLTTRASVLKKKLVVHK